LKGAFQAGRGYRAAWGAPVVLAVRSIAGRLRGPVL